MGKLICTILMVSWAFVLATGKRPNSVDEGPKNMQNWFKKASNIQTNQKITHLHFYLHDIVSGPNPTNIRIAMANSTAQSKSYFGLIAAIDDPLTEGPSPNSTEVGRAQGLFGSTSLGEIAYHMTFNLVFTNKMYNGSTLTLVGQNPFMHQYRELSVVGGTGVFRLARGSAVLRTETYNSTSGDAVVEYNVMVLHY